MKRALIIGGVFLLIILLFGLITLNLNYLLNRSDVKKNLKSIVKGTLKLELDYGKVSVDVSRLHLNFRNLFIEGSNFELRAERALLDFSWRKLLSFQFFPKRIHLNNFHLSYVQRPPDEEEEEEPFSGEKLRDLAKKISPLSMVLRNGTVDYTFINNKKVQLFLTSVSIFSDRNQLLLEANLGASFFSEGQFKLRYLIGENFLESSLKIRALDLAKVPSDSLQSFFKSTRVDLDLETVLEKDVLNLGFSGKAPTVVLSKGGQLSEGALRGYFVGSAKRFDLQIENLTFSYPDLSGNLSLKKDESLFELSASIKSFKLSEIRETLFPQLREEHSQRLSEIIREAEFSNFTVISKGISFSELFKPENLEIRARVSKGSLRVPERDINLTEISGDLSFHKKRLTFSGECRLEDQIELKAIQLELDLFERDGRYFVFESEFSGDAESVKIQATKLVNKLSFLEKWNVQGNLKGSLRLEGSPSELKPFVRLLFEGLRVKTPYQEDWVFIERGSLSFSDGSLYFSDLRFKYRDSHLESLSGTFTPENLDLYVLSSGLTLGKKTVEEFSQKNKDLAEWLKREEINFSHIILERAEYRGNISVDTLTLSEILENLRAEGRILDFSIIRTLRGKELIFQSPEVPFNLKDGYILVKEFALIFRESSFLVSGLIEPLTKRVELNGRGTLREDTISFLQELSGITGSPLALRPGEFLVKILNLRFSDSDPLWLSVQIEKEPLSLELLLSRGENYSLSGKIRGKQSDFEVTLNQFSPLNLDYSGTIDFSEVAGLFERPIFEEGLLTGNFSLTLFPERLSALISQFKAEEKITAFEKFLREEPFRASGYIFFRDLKAGEKIGLKSLLRLTGEAIFDQNSLIARHLNLRYGGTYLSGEFEFINGKPKDKLFGTLEIGNLNLRREDSGKVNATEPHFHTLERIFQLPLDVNIDIYINNLTLPTGHQIGKLKGNFTLVGAQILRLALSEINFCELKLYAEFEKNQDFQYFFVDLPEKRGEFLDLFSCLYPDEMPRTIFEGPFRIQGFFYTDGRTGLFENSYGQLEIHSDRGYLYRAPLIARLLAFLSPIDLFRGKIPNLETSLLPYEEFTLKGEFFDSSFRVDTVFLSAPGFRLFGNGPVNLQGRDVDLTFLVSPFRTLDVIIEHIPLLNRWLLGKERMLIYLPLQVVGKYDQPAIIPLHPASIGKGLFRFVFKFFGITEDFFRTPVNFEGFRKNELFRKRSGSSLFR